MLYQQADTAACISARRPVGVGATGSVFVGYHEGGQVAAKFFTDEMYLQEYMMMKYLARSGCVAGVKGAAVIANQSVVMMEAGRTTLANKINPAHKDTSGTARLSSANSKIDKALELFKVLATMHYMGVVHRDIKPGNIVMADGKMKLIDLGTSAFVADTPVFMEAGRDLTTFAVLSPEMVFDTQSAGERPRHELELSPAVDVWAMSLTVLQMLTGRYLIRSPAAGQHLKTTDQVRDALQTLFGIDSLVAMPSRRHQPLKFKEAQSSRRKHVLRHLFKNNPKLVEAYTNKRLRALIDVCSFGLIPEPSARYTSADMVEALTRLVGKDVDISAMQAASTEFARRRGASPWKEALRRRTGSRTPRKPSPLVPKAARSPPRAKVDADLVAPPPPPVAPQPASRDADGDVVMTPQQAAIRSTLQRADERAARAQPSSTRTPDATRPPPTKKRRSRRRGLRMGGMSGM